MPRVWEQIPTGRLKATNGEPEKDGTPDSISKDTDFESQVIGTDDSDPVPWRVKLVGVTAAPSGTAATHELAKTACVEAEVDWAETEVARLNAAIARLNTELGR